MFFINGADTIVEEDPSDREGLIQLRGIWASVHGRATLKMVWELAPVGPRAIKALVHGFRGTKSPEDKDILNLYVYISEVIRTYKYKLLKSFLTIIHLPPTKLFVRGSVGRNPKTSWQHFVQIRMNLWRILRPLSMISNDAIVIKCRLCTAIN